MTEPEVGKHGDMEDLFGDGSDDDMQAEAQPQQQLQDDAEAALAVFEEGEYDPEQQPEYAGEGAASTDAAPQEPAQEEYQPEDQWEQGYQQEYQHHDEAQEVGDNDEDELEAMFKPKKKRRQERDPSEKKAAVESFLARMEVAAQMDADANEERRPAIHKLQMLADVERELVKRDLQDEFLDGGVLGVLKLWLEPMKDGSLPNIKVRGAILRVLLDLNFFFEDRKEQLKKSQLGRIVMFLSKLPDEIPANRRMARELVQRWSRPIFEAYRNERVREEEATDREADELRAQLLKKKRQRSTEEPGEDRPLKPGDPGFRFSAVVPERAKLDYKRAPVSAVAQDASAGQRGGKAPATQSDRMMRKLDNISKQRKQSGKAAKVSVEGRGLVVG